MNVLIVDDNEIARDALRQIAGRIKDVHIIGECSDAMQAYNLLKEAHADVILLDIEMPGMTGLELTRNLEKGPLIIFTTSKRDYAVEAFELNVADYLIKPVSSARLIQAIDKARELLDSAGEEMKVNDDEFIFIRDSNIIKRLKLDDILFVESMRDYVKLHTAQRFYAIHNTLKTVEDRLPDNRFLRVHRSYIVAVSKIDTIREGVIVIQDKTVPVADAYRSTLNKRMNVL
ncbi:LytR/AlgR family response regulator transcription factor [Paraflavitalea pollutisoli]|uniref:LytR/AlgR family response regulator transcription factor n=1 Tax=Paraflavitalea pollutisoli TaxID=3034143 RepID=UPI0023EE11E1|nr:LytTR family DNA-binding domain-containing protein [Paraflavitalea sp. H1-2-19X]